MPTTNPSDRSGHSLVVSSPAKVNFFLEVLGKRPDGFHDIETLMCRVSLYDQLSFSLTSGPLHVNMRTIHSEDQNALPNQSDNLIYKILDRFRERAGVEAGLVVDVLKRIPMQAGLGGASSNAVTALLTANRLWGVHWPQAQLKGLANELGSDLAFFFETGLAWCRGRGERVQPIRGPLGWPLVIGKPSFGLCTRSMFSQLQVPSSPRSSVKVNQALSKGTFRNFLVTMFNRMEEPARAHSSWFSEVGAFLKKSGGVGGQMTGSGSCYFEFFPNAHLARRTLSGLKRAFPDCRWYLANRPKLTETSP